jgi:uncharacterized membrane protein YqjE
MDTEVTTEHLDNLGTAARRLMRRLMMIGENRVELAQVELEEERHRLFRSIVLGGTIIALGLLAGVAFTLLITVIFWGPNAVVALSVLTLVYAAGAGVAFARIKMLFKDWKSFPATIDQLKKDRLCLEKELT